MSLLTELKRRNVIRMAGLYLVGAWLIAQVAQTILPAFEVPNWVMRAIVIVLAIGFLPALAFAWVFELTSAGIKRDEEVRPEESIAPQTAQRMNRLIVAVLVLAVLYFGFDKFVLAPRREAADVAQLTKAKAPPAKHTGETINSKSIAVLPFTDLSPSHDQEYFSDGMAEELLNALAKVKTLKVAGRTSSFSFKGKNEDMRVIGKTLGVANILEGSVRKQGNKVRITAQLIQASDGFHLWSDSYDGDLSDVFALQERIARAIADKLQVVLSGVQTTRLVDTGTANPEAYSLYLQATSIYNRRDGDHFPEAVDALETAIRLDPKYARAHSRLAALYAVMPSYTDANVGDVHAKVEQYAHEASALDSTLAEPYAALGFSYQKFPRRFVEGFKAFEHALELDPDDVTTNFWFGLGQIKAGYRERGIALLDRALALDPMLPNVVRWRGTMYLYDGDLARAESMFRRARDLGLQVADFSLSKTVAAHGDNAAATRLWLAGTQATFRDMSPENRRIIAEGVYGDTAQRERAVAVIETFIAKPHEHVSQLIPEALLHLGRPDLTLSVMHMQQLTDTSDALIVLWSPQGRAMRVLPEFRAFLRDAGFLALWDRYGAPDDCQRKAPGEYVCE